MKKKIIILSLSLFIVICVGIFFAFFFKNNASSKNTNVAFVNISPKISETIIRQINQPQDSKIIFHNIEFSDISQKEQLKKYDLIISWEGSFTKKIESSSKTIPPKILSKIPLSLSSKSNKSLPILLDHYEVLYYNKTASKELTHYPSTYEQFEKYLYDMLDYVFVPFFTYGGDDKTLLAFISALIESKGGYDSYSNFVSILNSNYSFDELLNIPFGANNSKSLCLKDILDDLKKWKKDGIIHPLWFNSKFGDLEYFMNLNQIAVAFTSLSDHRKMNYNLIKDYTANEFPKSFDKNFHGLIAPTLLAMQIKDTKITREIILSLISENIQENLSSETNLSPTNSVATPVDKQADDVRFWTAACKYGSIADIETLAFQNDNEKTTNFCQKLRDYLSLP